MIEAIRTTRRTLIRWLIWAGILTSAPVAVRAEAVQTRVRDAATQLFSNREHAVSVGRAYLALNPIGADLDSLLDSLVDDDMARGRPFAELVEAMREGHRSDFRAERVVIVNGWAMSQTELRAAAVVALSTDADQPR